jgi:hypothetical protein
MTDVKKLKRGDLVWFRLPDCYVPILGIFVKIQHDGDLLLADPDGSGGRMSVAPSQTL